MLSVKSIRQGQNTNYYFEKDNNYYFNEDQAHLIEAFEWDGKGSTALGLKGQVLPEDFQRVMAGILPTGQQLGLKQGDTMKHRPGFDLTFSAPKSVSILALAGGDDRLIALHQKAVSVALEVAERLAQARVKTDGVMTYESTRNLVAAKFIHDTSREGDPHLHDHVVVANMTQCADGKWRSLASDLSRQNGFFERVMNEHTYIGMVYRSVMAKGLVDLGFELEIVNKHGMFEIEGVPQEVREMFSKRRQQIENSMKEKYGNSFKAYDVATQNTRKPKTPTDREALMNRWDDELTEKGWDPKAFLKEVAEKAQQKPENPLSASEQALTIVNDTMTILSERALSMEYGDIMRRAVEYGIGQCTHVDIVNAFEIGVKEKRFIPLDPQKSLWTTEKLIQTEVALMEQVKASQEGRSIFRLKEDTLDKRGLSLADQRLAKEVLTCHDRLMVLEHASGDKQAFLTQLLNTIEDQGRSVKILSPNAVHAHEIRENVERHPTSLWQWLKVLGKESVSDTVARFNFQVEKDLKLPIYVSSLQKGVIIVDAAQKMAPEAMKTLFEITEKLKSKVILLHDTEGQVNAFQGDVMNTLKKAGIRTFTRDTEHQQKPELAIKLYTVAEDEARLKAVALHYAHLSHDEQKTTVVVGQSLREARQLSREIREQLRNTGQLGHIEQTITTYQPVFLSATERKYAKHYEEGMVLRSYQQGHQDEWKVYAVLKEENALWLVNQSGEKKQQLCRKIGQDSQIFEEKALALSVGEKLMVTGHMKKMGLTKGETLVIKAINGSQIEMEKSGKLISLHLSEWEKSHVDHHYAESLSQLRTDKTAQVITSLKSRAVDQINLQLLTKKSSNITCYTNDAEKAERRFKAIPDKTTVIDNVMAAYHESFMIRKTLTGENVAQIKASLQEALAHLTKEVLKTPVEEAVDYAIAQLSERNAGFEHQMLVKTAIAHAFGKATLPEVEKILKQQVAEGKLVFGRVNEKTLWTTTEALTLEKEILGEIREGKNTQKPLVDKVVLQKALEHTRLNQGQKDACYLIGTTTDRFVMVQGFAGVGKSTMLGGLKEVLEKTCVTSDPIEILGCAPTHQAVKELENVGIKAQTLKSLLVEQEKEPADLSRKVILLDETSMVSNKDFHAFQTMIRRNNGRAVYAGDIAQYLSVESGKPMEIALKEGKISTAYMTEIVRQEVGEVKSAVVDIIQGDAMSAFKTIDALPLSAVPREENTFSKDWLETLKQFEGSIIEIRSSEKEEEKHEQDVSNISSKEIKEKDDEPMSYTLAQAVAAEYLSRPQEVRENTVIIIQTHEERKKVHEALFEGLTERGEIGHEVFDTMRLVSKGLTRVEARHYRSYKGGEVIRIRQGDYLTVKSVDPKTKSLYCEKPDGSYESIYPERIANRTPMEIYDKEKGRLSTGMRVKFTKTDKARNILANREWQVMNVSKEKMQFVEKETGRQLELNPHEYQDCHWDHAYTLTGYGAQGSSYRYVMDVAVSYLKHLTSMRAFYISVSRAKQHIMTFTNNKAALLAKLLKNKGDKYAALEVTGELKNKVSMPDVAKINQKKEEVYSRIHASNNAKHNDKKQEKFSNGAENYRPQNLKQSPQPVTKKERAISDEMTKKPRLEAKVVEQALKNKVEWVAQHCLGDANKHLSSSRQLRFGNKGSLVINIQGDKKGTWHDFEEDKGGSMIHLLQEKLNLRFKEALEYGASLAGVMPENVIVKAVKTNKKTLKIPEKNTQETALKLVKESLAIKGTLAEKYLNNTRQVAVSSMENLRFLPRVYTGKGNSEQQKYAPALLSVARDKAGVVQSIQVTYLDSKTVNKADFSIQKRTYGSPSGSAVILQKGEDKETYVTEGIETGLSIANVKPDARVLATLGKSNFGKIALEMLTEKVVFCLDNDGDKTISKGLIEAINRLEKAGKIVTCVMPEKIKNDFNDVMREGGKAAVLTSLNQPVSKDRLIEFQRGRVNFSDKRHHEVTIKEDIHTKVSVLNQEEKALLNRSNSINTITPAKSHTPIIQPLNKSMEREV